MEHLVLALVFLDLLLGYLALRGVGKFPPILESRLVLPVLHVDFKQVNFLKQSPRDGLTHLREIHRSRGFHKFEHPMQEFDVAYPVVGEEIGLLELLLLGFGIRDRY